MMSDFNVFHLLSRVTISLAEDCAARVHRLLTINNMMWLFFSDWFKHHLEVLARLSAKEIWSPVLSFFYHVLICEICPVIAIIMISIITSMMMVHKWSDNELSWIDYSRSTTLLELPSHLCKRLNKADDWENVWWMCMCAPIYLFMCRCLCVCEDTYELICVCFRVIVFVWIATLQIKQWGWKSPSHLFAVLRNWLRWASAPTFHAAAPEFYHHLGF